MIRSEVVDRVLRLTLDRRERRNALTIDMRKKLEALPDRYNDDPDVGCVLLRGAHDCFSAGADLAELRMIDPVPVTRPADGLQALQAPTIAFVDGMCVTGGLELALACDMIIATPAARFKDTHVALGVTPRWGLTARLPARIGAGRATDLLLSGRWIEADEALHWGLVDRVVVSAADALSFAAAIASQPDAAARATVALLRRDLSAELAAEAELAKGFDLNSH